MEAKGETDCLTEVQLENLVTKEDLVKVTGKHCLSGTYAFWYPEGEMSKTELETGQDIRLKTKGDGPFICKFDVQQSLDNLPKPKFHSQFDCSSRQDEHYVLSFGLLFQFPWPKSMEAQ